MAKSAQNMTVAELEELILEKKNEAQQELTETIEAVESSIESYGAQMVVEKLAGVLSASGYVLKYKGVANDGAKKEITKQITGRRVEDEVILLQN